MPGKEAQPKTVELRQSFCAWLDGTSCYFPNFCDAYASQRAKDVAPALLAAQDIMRLASGGRTDAAAHPISLESLFPACAMQFNASRVLSSIGITWHHLHKKYPGGYCKTELAACNASIMKATADLHRFRANNLKPGEHLDTRRTNLGRDAR